MTRKNLRRVRQAHHTNEWLTGHSEGFYSEKA